MIAINNKPTNSMAPVDEYRSSSSHGGSCDQYAHE
jgi:hypothetical protein